MNNSSSTINEFDIHLNQVTKAVREGKLSVAEQHIEALCKLAPNEPAIRFSLADVRLAMGDVQGAIKAIEDVPAQLKDNEKFNAQEKEFRQKMALELAPSKPKQPIQFDPFRAETIVYSQMKVVIVDTISQFMNYLGMKHQGKVLETDLNVSNLEEDKFGRPGFDAEVLTTVAANSESSILELGTSFGGGTYKLATNLKSPHKVFTVNILPEQFVGDCDLVTHLISKEEIGSFYRKHALANIEQIYANTLRWSIPQQVSDLSVVFIDAAHDTEAVFQDSKLTWDRLAPGGLMIWHDFSPLFRGKYDWINSVMTGVEKFLAYAKVDREIVNLRYSWMGVLRKPSA